MSQYKIDQDEYNLVINYFNNNNDNRTSAISRILGFSTQKVSFYIDYYLSRKANYMGDVIFCNGESPKNANPNEVLVYEFGKLIDIFQSISDAERKLGLSHDCVKMHGENEKTINHTKLNRKLTYIRR